MSTSLDPRRLPRRQSVLKRSAGCAVLLSAALVMTACGSRLETEEFAAVGSGTLSTEESLQGGVAEGSGVAEGEALPGDTGTTGGDPAAPVEGGAAVGSTGGSGGTSGSTGAGGTGGSTGGAAGTTGGTTGGSTGAGGTTGGAAGPRVGAAGAKTDPCAVSGATVKLGNISTQSGLIGELFKGLPEALQVWAKQANACGGLGGRPVEVISADDGGDPSTALTLAQRMVERDGVIAFIGLNQPLSVEGEADYLKKVGVPSIGGDASEAPFFNNPAFFPGGAFISVIGAATADIAIKRGKKKLAVFYCAEIPNSCGRVAASKFLQEGSPEVKKLGGDVVLYQQASLAAASFTSQCLAARNAGADAIIAILDGPSVGRMAGNCDSQGYRPTFIGIGLGLSGNLPEFKALNNRFFAPLQQAPWTDASTPAAKKYQADFKKYFGRVIPGPSPVMGYASGLLAQKATAAGLPEKPKASDIVKGLLSLKGENIGGFGPKVTFTSQLPRTGVESCYFVTAIQGGKYTSPEGGKCIPIAVKDPK